MNGGYKFSNSAKTNAQIIGVLAEFIEAGISTVEEDEDGSGGDGQGGSGVPYWHTEQHAIPRKSNPYGYLRLFAANDLLAGGTSISITSGVTSNSTSQKNIQSGSDGVAETSHTAILDDPEERLRVFDGLYRDVVTAGMERARREGGEEGRAASALAKVLAQS